jgi:hypothetical protein
MPPIALNPDPPLVSKIAEGSRTAAGIPISGASVLGIKRSLNRKFSVNVSAALPLVAQSSLTVPAEDLVNRTREASETLNRAAVLIREASGTTGELEDMSEGILGRAVTALGEIRRVRNEIGNVRKIRRDLAGKVLLLVLYVVAVFVRVLTSIRTGVWKVVRVALAIEESGADQGVVQLGSE